MILLLVYPILNLSKIGCVMHVKKESKLKSFKPKNMVTTSIHLQLIYMDLFDPSRTRSFGGNVYALFIVDDYSRYS